MILLKSEIAKKILNYFFINPHESLYVNELSKKLDLDKRNLVKKIKQLELDGILTCQYRGNLKLYSINDKYPLYKEYRKIIMKTVGFEECIRKILAKGKAIKEAYIYGSYAKDSMDVHSDIDILIVGEESTAALQKSLNKLQKEFGREINMVNMSEEEFKKRAKDNDAFISGILKQKHIKVI